MSRFDWRAGVTTVGKEFELSQSSFPDRDQLGLVREVLGETEQLSLSGEPLEILHTPLLSLMEGLSGHRNFSALHHQIQSDFTNLRALQHMLSAPDRSGHDIITALVQTESPESAARRPNYKMALAAAWCQHGDLAGAVTIADSAVSESAAHELAYGRLPNTELELESLHFAAAEIHFLSGDLDGARELFGVWMRNLPAVDLSCRNMIMRHAEHQGGRLTEIGVLLRCISLGENLLEGLLTSSASPLAPGHLYRNGVHQIYRGKYGAAVKRLDAGAPTIDNPLHYADYLTHRALAMTMASRRVTSHATLCLRQAEKLQSRGKTRVPHAQKTLLHFHDLFERAHDGRACDIISQLWELAELG